MVPTPVEAAALGRLRQHGADYADYIKAASGVADVARSNAAVASTQAAHAAAVAAHAAAEAALAAAKAAAPPPDPATLPPTSAAEAQARIGACSGFTGVEMLLASGSLPSGRVPMPGALAGKYGADEAPFGPWSSKPQAGAGGSGAGSGKPAAAAPKQAYPAEVHKAALLSYFKKFNPDNAVAWMVRQRAISALASCHRC